ncbi:MAG: extracellular solute-binding protein, partial [bacterium]
QYNTEEDYQGGVTTLTTEILSGQVPDLFSVSSMPISRIAAKGYLEDLWPWIEQDAELGGRSGVLEPVLNAMSTGEKLYYITPAVSLVTLGGPAQLVGTEMGWTVDDLLAAYRQMPPEADIMGVGMTKEQVLQSCLIMMQDDFVNWKTGEVRFDSEEFLNLMKFADLFPETFDWEAHYGDGAEYVSDEQRLMQGLQMLQAVSIYDFNEWRVYQEMMGGDMTFIGFPAGEGTVGSAFSVDSGIAMSSTCADKAGAWEFVRYFLSYDYQKDSSWSIPTNKQLFDERLKEAMTDDYYDAYDENGNLKRDENGNVVKERSPKTSWWIDENNRIELYAMEEADCAKLMDLINATTHIYQYDETLWNIISDECAAFFAGQQSAEDAARLIQSRMNIYVNEQR